MSTDVLSLLPAEVWQHFAALNAIPRPSKKEGRVTAFIRAFGQRLGLETIQDETGNVIIRKPATPGMEQRTPVVLQSHLDMVHQKNNDTVFDFEAEGIQMFVEGDWVRARGTTLGADNGIGVAAIMGILESKDLPHPALEALFTIDEETGMTGAMGLKGGVLRGRILLNLDTENDGELDIGCAGGIDVTATRNYNAEQLPQGHTAITVTVKGLTGGHSGMDIHKGLGNANKIMNRLLYFAALESDLRISSLSGGSLRNAIPRESIAVVTFPVADAVKVEKVLAAVADDIKAEYRTMEPGLLITWNACPAPARVMSAPHQQDLLRMIYGAPNGVYRMSADIKDLVETSNNVAKVTVGEGQLEVACLTRSSVESSKMDLAHALKAVFEAGGCRVQFSGSYPGWTPNVHSPILKVMTGLYTTMFGSEPDIVACHAGLECGILGGNYPGMDMISFGPTILGAHSPDERVSVSSVQKFWLFLQEVLKQIPADRT